MKFYRGEYKEYHPQFSPDSPAACGEQTGPMAMDAPKIEYTEEEDKIIDEYHRNFSEQHIASPTLIDC
jgi:alcohol oxidase